MLSGIPQVAQIGPSLVAKNGTPFCLFTCRRLFFNFQKTFQNFWDFFDIFTAERIVWGWIEGEAYQTEFFYPKGLAARESQTLIGGNTEL